MRIHNISDHPKFTPVHIKYKGGTIKPGESVELDPTLVPKAPCIATDIPNFYSEWKKSPTIKIEKIELPEQLVVNLQKFSETASQFAELVYNSAPKEDSVEEKPKKKK